MPGKALIVLPGFRWRYDDPNRVLNPRRSEIPSSFGPLPFELMPSSIETSPVLAFWSVDAVRAPTRELA